MPELLTKKIQQPILKDNRFDKIHNVTLERINSLQTLLDNSYTLSANSSNSLSLIFSRKKMLHNIKKLVRERTFLNAINESERDNLEVLEGILNIINSKDNNGNTPIMKAIQHDDIETLDYLLNKITTKIKVYNEKSQKNKIYLHNILDTKNNENKTALHIASECNLKCYNLILDYMKRNYSDDNKYNFVADRFDLPDRKKIKSALDDSEKLIEDSFSLAFYFSKDKKALLPSIDKLKSNLINSSISDAKKTLDNLFNDAVKANKSISKKELKKVFNSNTLCEKIDLNKNNPDILLSRYKVLTDINTSTGLTPVMQAAKNDDYKTLSLLIREIEYARKSYYEHSDKPLTNYLDVVDSNYNTALSFAIKNKSIKCVDLLLKSGTTLGGDIEKSTRNSYAMQAVKVHDYNILDSVIRSFKRINKDDNVVKDYLSWKDPNSKLLDPISFAIESEDFACALLLDERYKVDILPKYKNAYDNLKLEHKKLLLQENARPENVIIRIFINIYNSIVALLTRIGVFQIKTKEQ